MFRSFLWKSLVVVFGCAIIAFSAGYVSAADPAEGFWKSIDETGKVTAYWKLWVEGSELKGTIVKVPGKPDSNLCDKCNKGDSAKFLNKPILGTVWMWGFKKDGEKWKKGRIVDCGKGDVYWASVTVIDGGNAVEMKGSIDSYGWVGKKQVWKKTTEAEAKAAK